MSSHRRFPSRGGAGRQQRGNALIFALSGLLVSAFGAVGVILGGRLQARHAAGNGEATVLDNLRDATNSTASSGYGQFVRIGATRGPNLLGNLTVAGNTLFGGGGTHSEFRSALQTTRSAVSVCNASGSD